MKEHKFRAIVVVTLIFTILSPVLFPALKNTTIFFPGSLEKSAPIFINTNSDGQLGTTYPGTGTVLDPFRIENLTIDALTVGNAIKIQFVTIHVLIRNCTLMKSGSASIYAGINLEGCANITIQNCTIKNNRNGISLYLSQSITITGNNISTNSKDGLYLENASHNIISNNRINRNLEHGIDLVSSSSKNEISVNSFETNTLGHFYWDATGSGNNWYSGIIGNYWDDYTTKYPLAGNNLVTWNISYVINGAMNQNDYYPLVAYANVYSPTIIDGNDELIAFPRKSGLGTVVDPYVISNLIIGAGPNEYCLIINNINKPLVIENVTVTGADFSTDDAGIKLENCTNVNVTQCRSIKNSVGLYVSLSTRFTASLNTFTNSIYRGVILSYSSNISLYNNTVSTCEEDGIFLDTCQNVSISSSIIASNERGIIVQSSGNVTLHSNLVEFNNRAGVEIYTANNNSIYDNVFKNNARNGIYLHESQSALVNNNSITGSFNGIYILNARFDRLTNNSLNHTSIIVKGDLANIMTLIIDLTNKANNKPIIFRHDQAYLSPALFSNAGAIILANCSNSSIKDLILSSGGIGFQLLYSKNITIENCSLTGFYDSGIFSIFSTFNTINRSTFRDSNQSIYFSEGSDNNTINNCTLQNNHVGVFLERTIGNILNGNEFINCGLYLEGPDAQLNSHTIKQNNRVNQKVLYYYVNKMGLSAVNFSNAGQILMMNCSSSTVQNVDVSNATVGIILFKSTFNTLIGINSSFNSKYGIALSSISSDNNITGCTFNNNTNVGVLLAFASERNLIANSIISGNRESGIFCILNAAANRLVNNTIHKNQEGISTFLSSNQVNITGNNIAFNTKDGISIKGTSNHHIVGNNISFNYGVGINMSLGAASNIVYLNLVVDNGVSETYSTSTVNYWDNGTIGNYWGDYQVRYPSATRTGNIWNTPYEINGTTGVYDNHPFYRNLLPSADFNANYFVSLVGMRISFIFNGSTGDVPYTFQWYFGDGTPNSTLANPTHRFNTQSSFFVRLTVRDREGGFSLKVRTVVTLFNTTDFDGDSLSNQDEILTYHTNPLVADTDLDTIPDGWEILHSLNALNVSDGVADPDRDGLTNAYEYRWNTDPHNPDTDNDGFSDGIEVQWFSDPLSANDTPIIRWVVWPVVIAGILLICIIIAVRVKKQAKYKALFAKTHGAAVKEGLEFGSAMNGQAQDLQQRLSEKQTMLSRILSPQTRSEMEQLDAAAISGQDLEGLKAKKAKAASGSEEVIERHIDENLEQELQVQVKEEKCIVCETNLKGTSYVCPTCKTKYCIRCAIMLSDRQENCWTCKKKIVFD